VKHDGFRILAWEHGERVLVWARRGTDLTYRFPAIAEAVRGYLRTGQIIEDRTVRTIVAMAGGNQVSKRVRHGLHLSDARLKIADMHLSDALDLPARAAAVARSAQPTDLRQLSCDRVIRAEGRNVRRVGRLG
jgi:hypothetical protein